MAFRNKIYFIILAIVAQLFFFGGVRADELRPQRQCYGTGNR